MFKKKSRTALIIGSVFLVVTLLVGSVVLFTDGILPGAVADKPAESEEGDPLQTGEGEENLLTPMGTEDPGEEEEPEEPSEPVVFQAPGTMRGAYLTPGKEFITSADTSEETIKAEINKAVQNLKDCSLNSAIIVTNFDDDVIYRTLNAPELSGSFDVMQYLVDRCRAEGLYTYAIFDVSHYDNGTTGAVSMAVGATTVNTLTTNLGEFAGKYKLDGILIDGYINRETDASYSLYTLLGGAIGYDNYMLHTPEALVTNAAKAIRKASPNTQVGLLATGVWANDYENESGTATKASFSSLTDGNADTKAFVESGTFDFVAVQAYGSLTSASEPFGEIASWWADVAREANTPLYIVHASSKICTDEAGWASHDQITKQAIELDSISGVRGSVFNDLTRLAEDPKEATTTLIKYYRNEVVAEHILTELAVTKPEQTVFTTSETVVTFTGASDPNSAVTINGEEIPTDASGYFTVTYELKGGENRYTILHKEKTAEYVITRLVDILKEVSPQGSITTDGAMDITIGAWAYEGAEVSATINNTTVKLSIDETVVDEADRDSSYKYFTGVYTAPVGTASVQNLGSITVHATWGSEQKSLTGASVTVNKKAQIEDGVPVVVVADQARTYPPNTLNNIPNAAYYPLPKGAMDYAVGEELTYTKDGKTYKYQVLASGLRVESSDIQASSDYASGNSITALNMKVDGGYTYITLDTAQKVSYSINYTSENFTIQFHNTVKSPSSQTLGNNPLFTEANWSNNSQLSLKKVKTSGFNGFRAYYEGNQLVFRFNNPPASISGARIVIDPGHGGSDPGTLGFHKDYPERVLNQKIAGYLKSELEGRGATVLMLDTTSGMSLETRVAKAEAWNADLFVSVHNNSALNASAKGTEVYYFYPYASSYASNTASQVSGQLNTTNRGGKQSYYHVTLSAEFPSILVECGFMSNKDEYEKLINSGYQQKIATGIADGIAAGVRNNYTGISSGTTASADTGSTPTTNNNTTNNGQDNVTAGSSTVKVTGVEINRSSVTIQVGETYALGATLEPAGATDTRLNWSSDDEKVATISSGGTVTGVKSGTAEITVRTLDGSYTDTCTVTVEAKTASSSSTPSSGTGTADRNNAKADEVVITAGDAETVEVGSDLSLDARVYPEDASQSVTWTSSNDKVASVSSRGVVTGNTAGTAVITATSDANSSISCTIEINVVSVTGRNLSAASVSSLTFDEESVSLYKGTTELLRVDSDIGYIKNSEFTWKTSDSKIATVDSLGNVTAKSTEGEVQITATGRGKTLTCYVYVTTTREKLTGLYLDDRDMELAVGETSSLKVYFEPSDAANKQVTWSSNKSNIVSVDQNGNITALKKGTARITVKSKESNKFTDYCDITVYQEDLEEIWFENEDDYLDLDKGETYKLYVEFYPEDISNKDITWKSSKPSIVSVDSNGNLKALKKGTAVITATSKLNSRIKVTITVEVFD